MFMIYIHSHTQARRPFFHLGRVGLQREPVVGEAAEEPKGRSFHLLQRRDTCQLDACDVNIRVLFKINF